jgi:hypothetical protein
MRFALLRLVSLADVERFDDRLYALDVAERVHDEEFVDAGKRDQVSDLGHDGTQEGDEVRSGDVLYGDDLADKLGRPAEYHRPEREFRAARDRLAAAVATPWR